MNTDTLIRPDWFASDHHFGHENIIRFEPDARGHFNSVNHMNAEIVSRHNALVGENDVVFFLGDVALGRPFEEQLAWAGRMNGDKHLILGNHDRPHPIMTKNEERRAEFAKAYEEVGFTIHPLEMNVAIGDQAVKVHHYPYRGVVDGIEEATKHDVWRPEPSTQPLVHGHIHTKRLIRDNMFNVGIGLRNLEPTPVSVIQEWLDTL